MSSLSPAERKVVVAIANFIDEHGYSPSLDDIAKGSNYRNRSTCHTIVRRLKGRGILTAIDDRARSIRLAGNVTVKDGDVYVALDPDGYDFKEPANG